MIRILIVASIIASNGVYLAFDTINVKAETIGDPRLPTPHQFLPFLAHHSTSNNQFYTQKFFTDFLVLKHFSPPKSSSLFENAVHWYSFQGLSIVLSLIIYRRYKDGLKHTDQTDAKSVTKHAATDLEICVYRLLPLRTISRVWGFVSSVELPVSMRKPILGAYVHAFGCDLEEALVNDLTLYPNLSAFFRRPLKPGVRLVDQTANAVVSPADGTVLYFGKVTDGHIEHVKGVTYKLGDFFGPLDSNGLRDRELYYCVIYLSAGDYHRFHSPAEWSVSFRRHFAGKLLSVKPKFALAFPNLFVVNERVVYSGRWKYGFFSMTAVGAANVGSVRVYFDKDLSTNEKQWWTTGGAHKDYTPDSPVWFGRGDRFGEFNFGSTVVVVFEAPKSISFDVARDQKIKYGQLLCRIND